jgi:hypothetical protein
MDQRSRLGSWSCSWFGRLAKLQLVWAFGAAFGEQSQRGITLRLSSAPATGPLTGVGRASDSYKTIRQCMTSKSLTPATQLLLDKAILFTMSSSTSPLALSNLFSVEGKIVVGKESRSQHH